MTNRQIVGLVGSIVVAVLIGVGLKVYSVIQSVTSARSSADRPRVALFEDATWLGPAFEDKLGEPWLASTRKLTLANGSVELVTQREGVARRYTVAGNGSILRRGGASLVAAEPFDLRTLDLGLVPQLVAEAQEHTGVGVRRLIVGRDEEGLLLWRAIPSGEAVDVYFRADGSYVPDPDDP